MSIALYLSRYRPPLAGLTDPHGQAIQASVWTAQPSETGGLSLRYYQVLDHPRRLDHLSSLLALHSNASIHVALDKQWPNPQEVLLSLEEIQAGNTSSSNPTGGDAAAPADSVLDVHAKVKQLPLESILKSRVQGEAGWQVARDAQLSADQQLRQALMLLLSVVDDQAPLDILPGNLPSSLMLDPTAAESIHLWPPPSVDGGRADNSSLYGVLAKHISTTAGKRQLAVWLAQPLVDLEAIVERQETVAFWVEHGIGRDAMEQEGLRLLASLDLKALAANLGKYQQNQQAMDDAEPMGSTRKALQALYQLYLVAGEKIPILTEAVSTAVDGKPLPTMVQAAVEGLQQVAVELGRSVELAQAVLDLDQAPREFLVKASYKAELSDIQAELHGVEAELEQCHAEMNETWASVTSTGNANEVRLEEADGGWQFRLPNTNDSKLLQNQLGSAVTVHRLLKNGVYFTTKELRQLSCKKQDLVAEYERHQRQVVMAAMLTASTYQSVLERANDIVAELDALVAMAHVAAYKDYCRPTMTDGVEDGLGIELKGARHPCVELQENIDFIPNDISLIYGKSSFLLVTGPNMGGKSTYIRSLGAIVTLAQIGCFVPCTSAKINICHHILARVGAGDLQERGISTFMAEMLESSAILKRATKRSLIIIDELGRGTSTFDGYGLARAISEYIVQKLGCMTVFTTHFHELTALENQEPAVQNCHVTAQKGSHGLTFLYEVKPGPCLESFGIQVAEMANVPHVVIQDAKLKAKELENFEYRKRKDNDTMQVDDTDDTIGDHDAAEIAAEAMAFTNRFCRLPLESMLQSYSSDEERRGALLQALQG